MYKGRGFTTVRKESGSRRVFFPRAKHGERYVRVAVGRTVNLTLIFGHRDIEETIVLRFIYLHQLVQISIAEI